MSEEVNVPATFGALLLGGLFATVLSGMVQIQTIQYYRTFREDSKILKAVVGSVACLDLVHLTFVWLAVWNYLITKFGRPNQIDDIYWSISLSVVITGCLTLFVHGFFASRIFLLSNGNYYITIPIVVVAVVRVVSACSTAGTMLHHESFHLFKQHVSWLFTTGLALSTSVDIMIAVAMAALLNKNRKNAPSMVPVLNYLMMYTFETGVLTTAGTIISMFFWILKSHNNLTFLGLHFVIAKLYATSLLVTLNLRESLKSRRHKIWTFSGSSGDRRRGNQLRLRESHSVTSKPVEINVQKTVELQGDIHHTSSPTSPKPFDLSTTPSNPRSVMKLAEEDEKSSAQMVVMQKRDSPEGWC